MHTLETRKIIGFPTVRENWNKAKAVYDQHALRIAGHPVMEDWEQGYMEKLAEIAASRGGLVLEVGYGMGLSARAIQGHNNVKKHLVIECHPDVVGKCVGDFRGAIETNKFHIMSGFWQDVTPTLGSEIFDGILFDTYPLKEEEIHSNHFDFFKEAFRLLKPGGVLTYYSDEAVNFSEQHLAKILQAGFLSENVRFDVCKVNPPADCEYWQANTLIAPILVK